MEAHIRVKRFPIKTRVILHRIPIILEHLIAPKEVMVMDFNKALIMYFHLREMISRRGKLKCLGIITLSMRMIS
jgi:superfamily I DNA/RNA helicase